MGRLLVLVLHWIAAIDRSLNAIDVIYDEERENCTQTWSEHFSLLLSSSPLSRRFSQTNRVFGRAGLVQIWYIPYLSITSNAGMCTELTHESGVVMVAVARGSEQRAASCHPLIGRTLVF